MYGVLRAHGKRYWISRVPAARAARARRLTFRDERAALLFLRQLVAVDGEGYARVRRLLREQRFATRALRFDDDSVLHTLAAHIASSELLVHATDEPLVRYHFPEPVEEAAPAPIEVAAVAPEPEPPPPVTPAEFEDVEAQVAALRQAAEEGMPFCEECQKAREQAALEPSADFADTNEEAQVAALVAAAEEGVPFCEECEKAKLAAAEPPGELGATDAEAQAQVMVSAAETGAPFCEECEKARDRA